MTPICVRCAYDVSAGRPAQASCPACQRALLLDVAFSPRYRGVPLDRMAAGLIALIAAGVAVAANTSLVVLGAAAAVVVAAVYALIPRRRLTGLARRRAFRRAHRPGASAAAAAPSSGSPIAVQRRPQPTTRQ
jgi:hypothetical protein